MKVINIEVTDKLKVTSIVDGETILNSGNPVRIASGNYKSILLNFDFSSSSWDESNLDKFATFLFIFFYCYKGIWINKFF